MIRMRRLDGLRFLVVAACAICAAAACAQVGASAVGADGKPLAFEVATIRESKPGTAPSYGPTADGYRMARMPLMVAILSAYTPTNGAMMYGSNTMQGFPEWAMNTSFDVDARVAEADLAEWRKPTVQPAMVRAMLAALLAERCKLVVHRDVKEVPVYHLTAAKGAGKMKETLPDEVFPAGQALPGGGVMSFDGSKEFHLYGATMTMFSVLLSNMSGRPVQDTTGLTGKYDLVMQRPSMGMPAGGDATDSQPTLSEALGALGLELEPAKGMVETLVVDHVERPSEN